MADEQPISIINAEHDGDGSLKAGRALMVGYDASTLSKVKINADSTGDLQVDVKTMPNITLTTGDIEIGAVELKNGADDTRAVITAANALKVDGSAVTQPVDTELPAVAALADTTTNPTTTAVGTFPFEFNGTTWDRKRNQYAQTTTGITATGNGTAISMADPQRMFAIVATMAGDTSTFDVRLEGSLDNSSWTELVQITNVSPGDGKIGFAIDKPVLYARYRIAGITRISGTLTVVILATD